jgi:hypothetical protein
MWAAGGRSYGRDMRGRLLGIVALGLAIAGLGGGCGSGTVDTSTGAAPTTTKPASTALQCEPGELIGTSVGDVGGDYAAPDQTADEAFDASPGGQSARARSGSDQSVTRESISASQVRYAVRTNGKVRLRMVVEKAPRGGWVITTVEQCEPDEASKG